MAAGNRLARASTGTTLVCAANSMSSSTSGRDGSSTATISRPPRSSSGSAGSRDATA